MNRNLEQASDLRLQLLEFSHSDLAKLPKDERVLFLLFGHIANELSVLNKLHLWCSHDVQADGIVGQAGIVQASMLSRLLASKVFEAWRAIERSYFATKLSKRYEALLSDEGLRALDRCKKYFSSSNGLFYARNNFGFHYSIEEVEVGYSSASRDEMLRIYLADERGNNLYYASEMVFGTALASQLGAADVRIGIERLLGDMVSMSREVQTFLDQCIATILIMYFGDPKEVLRPVSVPNVPALQAVRIPYFIASEGT